MAPRKGSKGKRPSSGSKKGPTPTYTISLKSISAEKLVGKDLDGGSDPYIQFELEGDKDKKYKTNHINNTLNPVWKEDLTINGYFVANDLLRITVFDHDAIGSDDAIGGGELLLRNVPLGVTSSQEVPLQKCIKGKVDKKSAAGSGGTAKFKIHVQRLGQPAAEKPWTVPFYTAQVEFVSAKDVPIADAKRGTVDPFVVAKLSTPNSQKTKTKTKKKSTTPVWNEPKTFLLGDLENDKLKLLLFNEGPKPKTDEKISDGALVFKDFKPGHEAVEKELKLKPVEKFPTGGTILLKVKVEEIKKKDTPPPPAKKPAEETKTREGEAEEEPFECHFEWKSYSSSYTTNFTGYTTFSGTLSKLRSSEDAEHHHEDIVSKGPPKEKKKVEGKEFLKGTLKGAKDLVKADSDGAGVFVQVELVGKHKTKRKPDSPCKPVKDTSDPDFDYDFDLGEVRKGLAVEFNVFQVYPVLGNTPIGYARVEVKNIQIDDDQVQTVELKQPPLIEKLPRGYHGSWGVLEVQFDKTFVRDAGAPAEKAKPQGGSSASGPASSGPHSDASDRSDSD